ncbi:hypothetical protein GOP47_0017693 [Adiantum capillus-veneris]|uniref:Glycosyltransferase n=1 Tax=Adiantum capillus-veneris TaxID=13818 RepID=A0A9D4ZB25_ADICA|nr:hypothetical protein GOP47_0017693 [Adiantum capillus-veneris]
METVNAPPHMVLVPLPAQGHINPFISIANYLAASGVSVTLVRSARAHSLLSSASKGSSPSDPPQNTEKGKIRIEVVPDGMSVDPTQHVPVGTFLNSINIIRNGVEELLYKLMQEEQPPCCLLVDNLIGWGHDVAVKFGLAWMMLWTGSASGFSIGFYIPQLVARGYIPAIGEEAKQRIVDFIPGMSPFCIRDLPKAIIVEEDPSNKPMFQFFLSIYESAKHADRLLVNSIYELENSVVEALRKEAGFKIEPIGPLFMMGAFSDATKSPAASLLQEDTSCLYWLDEQQESSVLYISFGSVASIEEDAVKELAYGLEASGLNFLWVIRPDALPDKKSVEDLFPEGFIERTCDRGRVISWAPQLAVLGHRVVGAFLTHCGWNSVLESLCNGVPMLGFPLQADQNTNLQCIVHDWKVGLPLLKPNVQQVERLHAQWAMTAIMRGDEGREIRKHVIQWKEVAINAVHGSSKANLEKLVDDLKCGRLKSTHEATQS